MDRIKKDKNKNKKQKFVVGRRGKGDNKSRKTSNRRHQDLKKKK